MGLGLGALQLQLSVMLVYYQPEAGLQKNGMCLSILITLRYCLNVGVPMDRHFTFTCFTLLRRIRSNRDGNVYVRFNAPEWLQDCMPSVELKWHMNEQVEGSGRELCSRMVSLQICELLQDKQSEDADFTCSVYHFFIIIFFIKKRFLYAFGRVM